MEEQAKYYQLILRDDDNADLYIFGDIVCFPWEAMGEASGWSIVQELESCAAENITVHINSYGGVVSEGLAIYNTLVNSGKQITTVNDGFACSAASIVFCAGTKRIMNAASLLMIHPAYTQICGNADMLRKEADTLDAITSRSVEVYKSVAAIPEKTIIKLMSEETWITPEDAVAWGFATEIRARKPGNGAEQSAFDLIMRQLTTKPVEATLEAADTIDVDALADSIADKVTARMSAIPVPTSEQTDKTGWDNYFNRKE